MPYVDDHVVAPVGLALISRLLGGVKRSVANLCRAKSVNKWSHWKPFRNTLKDFTSEEQKLQAMRAVGMGFTIPVFTNPTDFVKGYKTPWTYNQPESGAECRILDFEGYTRTTFQEGWESPKYLNTIFKGLLTVNSTAPEKVITNGDSVTFAVSGIRPAGIDHRVYPIDFGDENSSPVKLPLFYFGIAIIDYSGNVLYKTNDTQIKNWTNNMHEVTIEIPNSWQSGNEYTFVPIFSARSATELTTMSAYDTFVTLNGQNVDLMKYVETYGIEVYIDNVYTSDYSTYVPITLANTRDTEVTITELFSYLFSEYELYNSGKYTELVAATEQWVSDEIVYRDGIEVDGSLYSYFGDYGQITLAPGEARLVEIKYTDIIRDRFSEQSSDHFYTGGGARAFVGFKVGSERAMVSNE